MKRFIALVVCAALIVASFSGCAVKNVSDKLVDEVVDVVVIAANRACNKIHNYNGKDIQKILYESFSSRGYVTVINLDGNPTEIGSMHAELDGINPAAQKRNVQSAVKQVTGELQNLKAISAESDLLTALKMAANILNSSSADKKIVVVADNFLTTTGYMNMTDNLLSKDIDSTLVVQKLTENHYIPDFHDVSEVVVQNFGEVSAPQQNLTPNMQVKLTELWEEIITAAGSEMRKVSASLGNQNPEDFPLVSTVPIIEDEPLFAGSLSFTEPLFISESQIGFLPDSAEIRDKQQALNTLTPVAQYMADHPSFRLLIAGCCAGDLNSDFGKSLSCQRAAAIRDILIGFGVDKSRLETVGTGSDNPWHQSGITDLSSAFAEKNRVCVLIDASTRADYGI